MSKKAFLVGFSLQTRVVVDIPGDFDGNVDSLTADKIILTAREKILSEPTDYLHGDNVDLLEEDVECPYDPKTDNF